MIPSTVRISCFALLLIGIAAQGQNLKDQPPLWSAKPDIAAFEKLENDRLAAAQRAIENLLAQKAPHTIENTLVLYDEAIRQLHTARYFANEMQLLHPDATYRDQATAMTTRVSDALTSVSLNNQIYQALAALDVSQAEAATRYYVKRELLKFKLAGVDKDDETRARIRKLQEQLTQDVSMFDRNLAESPGSIEVASAADLDGLPQDYIDLHKPGPDGKIRITTSYPDYRPVITFATNVDVRRRLADAFQSRAFPKNRDVLLDMMRTRYEIATLVGYSSWADYNAADKMIVDGRNIGRFIQDLDAAARPIAEREYAMLLAEQRKTDPAATEIAFYNESHLRELVRRSQYDFDSESVRAYLPYNQVKQGILDVTAKLFHVTFQQEINVPAWDPSVETWDVFEGNKPIGRFYLDMHPRPGKYSHNQSTITLDAVRGKQLPEGTLICNFPEPTATDPGLMTYGDVVTFFHEFGHVMHIIVQFEHRWAGLTGALERDFIETPSQMLEEWMRSPQVLATFAHHYKTGAPIPAELVMRMNRASAFGRGLDVTLQTTLSAISYDIYKDKPESVDLDAVTIADFRKYSLPVPMPSLAHMYANFNHLGGYSSMFYTYMWDKVIAEDFFSQFDQSNLLTGSTAMRYRRIVLEPGGSKSANDLVKDFLGRPQNMVAFRRWLDEEFEMPRN